MTDSRLLETGFMDIEDTDRQVSLGIGTVAIVDGPPPSPDDLHEWLDRGLRRQPRLRQRIRRRVFDLRAPVWETDTHFDLGHHIRWAALPGPGRDTELEQLIANELTERLDRDHPLWTVVVVERLAGDRWALILEAHHTMLDGISEITLLESFCDPVAPDHREGPTVTRSRLGYAGRMKKAAQASVALPGSAVRAIRVLAPVLYAVIAPASDSSLNGPLGRRRRYTIARTHLPQVREVAATFDVTVNDVAVAAVAAAYRRLLSGRGEQPVPADLRIVIPISTREENRKQVLDNRVSAMIAHLPVEIDHPVRRLMTVHEQIRHHRARREADYEKSLLSWARRLPFGLMARVVRLAVAFPQRGVVTLATDIPGPQRLLTLGGRTVHELWPCIPIAMRIRTSVAVLSYRDQLTFGITGDYDTTPDIHTLSSGITAEIAVLAAHARRQRETQAAGNTLR
ncbi:wax ester/triacylglycerol synthase family O-acyltransferase [Nocardia speluncae]|uniref:Diacylglycerol O-acyltransferase n=1 Tax=Nocardia speluncae TaxID=419477 RepID=A0A846X9K7_9NOCA|nr:wax ester/triacylglycerol synthase family O-acyltransferase [Nocardia speluncae]NKY32931.1 wax ester/triacylglycerol synthase family O-acyltransferase [Nocardia speluncae]